MCVEAELGSSVGASVVEESLPVCAVRGLLPDCFGCLGCCTPPELKVDEPAAGCLAFAPALSAPESVWVVVAVGAPR
jgi:hypothetical protein